MPALAATQPNYPGWLDLHDADSPVDRQLASMNAAAATITSVLQGIYFNPPTASTGAGAQRTARTYPRPAHIVGNTEIDAYEDDIDALLAAMAGVTGILNRLRNTATR